MAKTVTIEFTDAHWALIAQYFPPMVGGYAPPDDTWTEAALAEAYQRHIALNVQQAMRADLATSTEFDSIFEEG